MIPIDITFRNKLLFEKYRIITLCFTISLVMNVLIRLNTVVYKFGKAIVDREEIFKAYLSEGLIIDVIFCGELFLFLFKEEERTWWLKMSLFAYFS